MSCFTILLAFIPAVKHNVKANLGISIKKNSNTLFKSYMHVDACTHREKNQYRQWVHINQQKLYRGTFIITLNRDFIKHSWQLYTSTNYGYRQLIGDSRTLVLPDKTIAFPAVSLKANTHTNKTPNPGQKPHTIKTRMYSS